MAENLQIVQKCCNLISARTGKDCITWRMFRTLLHRRDARERMLLHFVSCDWHCGWTPAEYAANAVYLQWGLQTYPKNGQLLLFPKRWTVRQRIFGKTENEICCATTGLMKHQPRKNWSVWFRQSFGLTNKAKHNPPICNCVFWYRMFYPPRM